jgi:hypothetical protein
MKLSISLCVITILVLAFFPLQAQMGQETEPGEALISLYRVAPGKHLEFLKWQAANEAVNAEAGIPATKWYAHTNGDAWDYIAIGPITTDEQSKKFDEIATKKGIVTGPKAGLQFRQFINWHSDTFVAGPMTAAQMVKALE